MTAIRNLKSQPDITY